MTKEEAREAVREAYDWGDPEYANEIIKALEQEPKTRQWVDDEFGSKCSCCGIHTHKVVVAGKCVSCGKRIDNDNIFLCKNCRNKQNAEESEDAK